MGVGSGTILTSAHSRQKLFKVLSERLIETSKGRKTKAHPSPASTLPSTTALVPARDLGPCRGRPVGRRGGLRTRVPQTPNQAPKLIDGVERKGSWEERARVPMEGENFMKEKNLRKALS